MDDDQCRSVRGAWNRESAAAAAKLETPGARTRDSHSLAHNIKHIKCGPQHEIYKTKCNINIVTQSKDTKINAKYKLLVRVSGNVFEKRI